MTCDLPRRARRRCHHPDHGGPLGQYKYHIFVCTFGKTCAQQGAEAVLGELKDQVKAHGIKKDCRVNKAGCMHQCGHGPMVVVYPEDTWYAGVDVAGARRIVAEHLVEGRPVEEYRYHAPPGDNKDA